MTNDPFPESSLREFLVKGIANNSDGGYTYRHLDYPRLWVFLADITYQQPASNQHAVKSAVSYFIYPLLHQRLNVPRDDRQGGSRI
jgi:hypothetical protein